MPATSPSRCVRHDKPLLVLDEPHKLKNYWRKLYQQPMVDAGSAAAVALLVSKDRLLAAAKACDKNQYAAWGELVVRFLCSKTVDDQAVAPGRFLTYHRGLQAKLRELGYHEDALCLRITGEA